MARGRPVGIVQAVSVLACVVAGSHAAFAQATPKQSNSGLSLPGINLGLIKISPTTLSPGGGGASVVLPGISVGGLATVSSTSVNLSKAGASVSLPGANVAGLANVSAASVNVSKAGTSVSLPSANVAGSLVNVSSGSLSLSGSGVSTTLPGVNVAGNLVNVSPGSLSLSGSGAKVALPGVNVANVISVSPTTANIGSNGVAVTLPSASVGNLVNVTPGSLTLNKDGINVTVPGATVIGVGLTETTVGLSKDGLSVNPGDITTPAGKVELPSLGLNTSGSGSLVQVGGKGLESVINQASPIAQFVANAASSEAMASIDQLVGGLTLGEGGPAANCVDMNSVALAPTDLGVTSWNSVSISSGEHDGYRVSGDAPSCGGSMPFQTLQRTYLPGTVWDASKSFGMKPGSLHFGFSGGTSESDTRTKATDLLRGAGFSESGSTRLTSWSLGGYSLYTTEKWYAGTALGAAWGQAEAQNFVLGSESEYATSGYVVAGFVGTVVPVTEMLRFDLRSTLSFQRTVGDAHVDSIGVRYGEHVIESADAVISGRLFGVFQDGDTILRPFVQAGVTHHLTYSNQLEIDGLGYRLHEADTSLFTAAGVDVEITRAFQFSIGVRHDYSPDEESVTGRIGFTARFN